MISQEECAIYAGITPGKLPSAVIPSAKHWSLLESYRLNLWRGEGVVGKMILGDFWRFVELGAKSHAADLFLVLRLFLTQGASPDCIGYGAVRRLQGIGLAPHHLA
jgi:hypothetical protein